MFIRIKIHNSSEIGETFGEAWEMEDLIISLVLFEIRTVHAEKGIRRFQSFRGHCLIELVPDRRNIEITDEDNILVVPRFLFYLLVHPVRQKLQLIDSVLYAWVR